MELLSSEGDFAFRSILVVLLAKRGGEKKCCNDVLGINHPCHILICNEQPLI
jgi:hypothetical protein